jgi:hypothetical protein
MSLYLTPVDFFSLPPRDMNNVNIMWGHFFNCLQHSIAFEGVKIGITDHIEYFWVQQNFWGVPGG